MAMVFPAQRADLAHYVNSAIAWDGYLPSRRVWQHPQPLPFPVDEAARQREAALRFPVSEALDLGEPPPIAAAHAPDCAGCVAALPLLCFVDGRATVGGDVVTVAADAFGAPVVRGVGHGAAATLGLLRRGLPLPTAPRKDRELKFSLQFAGGEELAEHLRRIRHQMDRWSRSIGDMRVAAALRRTHRLDVDAVELARRCGIAFAAPAPAPVIGPTDRR